MRQELSTQHLTMSAFPTINKSEIGKGARQPDIQLFGIPIYSTLFCMIFVCNIFAKSWVPNDCLFITIRRTAACEEVLMLCGQEEDTVSV